ncbi:MAG: nitroreductase family deazaflavin-dependent oxidoreductase [Cryobacterium sp.]|nr:nitroreductase family deazaflavin-dependent oxidoreductase [Cryobacterium sp.]MBX3104898.1 nitroreductase family deazaflavin-dependent oxidoreductase [Cryobacterium sp.]
MVRIVRLTLAPLTRTRVFRWLGPRTLPLFERILKGVSANQIQVSGLLVHSLTLLSKGARTSEIRATELMYTPDGLGRAIVAGTSFAREKHPGWTWNLLANPEAEIIVRGRHLKVQASLIADEHRDAAWTRIESQWPGYRAYERKSGRIVRLFLLKPTAELGRVEPPTLTS